MSESNHILEMQSVSKRYPGTLAVDGVSFNLQPGEVHALMGENGAGKSSLMNMMSGAFSDYEGDIYVDGTLAHLHSPAMAKSFGIEMIHQELANALPLSIAENMLAGNLPRKGLFLDKKAMAEQASLYLSKVGLKNLSPWTKLEKLSPHEQQLVEIAKALSNHPRMLIMDEPTSSLSRAEVEKLFHIVDQLKHEGLGIVYISHYIPEIFRIADRVTVMRDGKWVGCDDIADLSPEKLVEMMIGQAMSKTHIVREHPAGDVLMEFQHLTRRGFFHDINFSIKKGEILGIGGLAGSGRSEIARSISGLDPLHEGSALKDGEPLYIENPLDAIKQGIAYLSEDRKTEGLALDQSSECNAVSSLTAMGGLIPKKVKQRETYLKLAKELNIYPADPQRLVNQYSGGNQQKVLLAKWMAVNPALLILDEPTRGVDIGAKQLIHEVVAKLADSGMSILLITSDLPELVELSDRVLILRNGHICGELTEHFTEESILLAANGA